MGTNQSKPASPTKVVGKSAFQYDKLEQGQIRILILLPSQDHDDEVFFQMERIQMEDSSDLDYEAISYAWGDLNSTVPIYHSEGAYILVTHNLVAGLRRFRHQTRPRRVWADAVCINQEDESERTSQVLQMKDIYAKATGVLAWLGEIQPGMEGAMESLSTLNESVLPLRAIVNYDDQMTALQENWSSGELFLQCAWNFRSLLYGRHSKEPLITKGRKMKIMEALTDFDWSKSDAQETWTKLTERFPELKGQVTIYDEFSIDAISNMLSAPYFSRLWVLQEILNAKDVTFHLGVEQCGMKSLPIFMNIVALLREDHRLDDGEILRCEIEKANRLAMASNKIMVMTYPRLGFMTQCICSANSICSEPKDYVFARLGLLSSPMPDSLDLSYAMSAQEIFQETTKGLLELERGGSIDCLYYIEAKSDIFEESVQVPPSWVIDFAHLPVYQLIIPESYNACGETGLQFVTAGASLKLQGRIVDVVAATRLGHSTVELTRRDGWSLALHDISTAIDLVTHGKGMTEPTPQYTDLIRALTREQGFGSQYVPVSDEVAREHWKLIESIRDYLILGGECVRRDNYPHMTIATGMGICTTKEDRIGSAPDDTKADDLICIFDGGKAPFVIRAAGNGAYRLVGSCYLSGVMYAETMGDGRYQTQEIVLV